jgi:peptidoglycan/xylan/chitin deacetylase (PgdA/CDA1 family)
VAATLRQLDLTTRAIVAAGVRRPRLLRPPYGAGLFSARLRALARTRGLVVVGWDISADRYLHDGVRAALREITRRVRPGSIILLHDGIRHRTRDIELLGPLLDALSARCLRPVTISSLLRDAGYGHA